MSAAAAAAVNNNNYKKKKNILVFTKEIANQSCFPPSCPVLYYNAQTRKTVTGIVSGAFLDLGAESTRETMYVVVPVSPPPLEEREEIHVREGNLMFAPDCPVFWKDHQVAASVSSLFHHPPDTAALYVVKLDSSGDIQCGVKQRDLSFRPTDETRHLFSQILHKKNNDDCPAIVMKDPKPKEAVAVVDEEANDDNVADDNDKPTTEQSMGEEGETAGRKLGVEQEEPTPLRPSPQGVEEPLSPSLSETTKNSIGGEMVRKRNHARVQPDEPPETTTKATTTVLPRPSRQPPNVQDTDPSNMPLSSARPKRRRRRLDDDGERSLPISNNHVGQFQKPPETKPAAPPRQRQSEQPPVFTPDKTPTDTSPPVSESHVLQARVRVPEFATLNQPIDGRSRCYALSLIYRLLLTCVSCSFTRTQVLLENISQALTGRGVVVEKETTPDRCFLLSADNTRSLHVARPTVESCLLKSTRLTHRGQVLVRFEKERLDHLTPLLQQRQRRSMISRIRSDPERTIWMAVIYVPRGVPAGVVVGRQGKEIKYLEKTLRCDAYMFNDNGAMMYVEAQTRQTINDALLLVKQNIQRYWEKLGDNDDDEQRKAGHNRTLQMESIWFQDDAEAVEGEYRSERENENVPLIGLTKLLVLHTNRGLAGLITASSKGDGGQRACLLQSGIDSGAHQSR